MSTRDLLLIASGLRGDRARELLHAKAGD